MPWYRDGLRFQCTQCGACCTGSPGYVWIDEEEATTIAEYLKIPVEDFVHRYTHRVNGRLSLREDPRTYDCVFLKGKRCEVYGARPKQCRTFPWWRENLESKETWNEASLRCEGINHPEARVVAFEEIENILSDN